MQSHLQNCSMPHDFNLKRKAFSPRGRRAEGLPEGAFMAPTTYGPGYTPMLLSPIPRPNSVSSFYCGAVSWDLAASALAASALAASALTFSASAASALSLSSSALAALTFSIPS